VNIYWGVYAILAICFGCNCVGLFLIFPNILKKLTFIFNIEMMKDSKILKKTIC